jgi:ABC-type multidrug transport system ATPase subunit
MAVIRARHLTKRYGKHLAVDGLSLDIGLGEIYGFLGPNGAGKTTTIMMILGLLEPTSGEISLFGRSSSKGRADQRSRIGVVTETQHMYSDMTAREYLMFFADFYSIADKHRKVDEVLSRLGLYQVRNRCAGAFSKGMKQKLALARALLHDPDLLILDEPVSGLDPLGVKEIRDIILGENSKGKSLLISSHILSEIEKTCHRVGIINRGVLVAEDTMDGIRRSTASEIRLEILLEAIPDGLLKRLSDMPFVVSAEIKGGSVRLTVKADRDHRGEISRAVVESGGVILGFVAHEVSLEEAFITITESNVNRLLREAGEL